MEDRRLQCPAYRIARRHILFRAFKGLLIPLSNRSKTYIRANPQLSLVPHRSVLSGSRSYSAAIVSVSRIKSLCYDVSCAPEKEF